jgi:hypothetical protein
MGVYRHLPVFALQRAGPGWLIWAPYVDGNPCTPAVRLVGVVTKPGVYGCIANLQGARVIRAFRSFETRTETRGEANNKTTWPREQLFEIARLLDRLDVRDIEHFCLQRAALSHELRRLAARWAVPRC